MQVRIPVNLLVFLAIAGIFYLVILPKKTRLVSGLMATLGAHRMDREDSVKTMVEARILVDLCPKADLSEYRAGAWTEYHADGDADAEITHEFTCDEQMRKYLFRLHYGEISEIIDLR